MNNAIDAYMWANKLVMLDMLGCFISLVIVAFVHLAIKPISGELLAKLACIIIFVFLSIIFYAVSITP